jgi:hypothetical protein
MLPENVGYITILIQLIGAFFYIRQMVRGTTKPNLVSWTIWSLAPLIGAWLDWKAGGGLSVFPVFMAGFNSILVVISALILKEGYWKITKLDIFCGILAILALVLWIITRNFSISILFAILSDGLAALPTIFKTWKNPESESFTAFLGGIISNIIGLLIIKNWIFPIYSMLIYFILLNTFIIFCIYRKKIASFFN